MAQRPQGLPAKEAIAGQIRTHLQGQKQQEGRETYLATLRAKYKAQTFLTEARIDTIATEVRS